MFPKLLTVTAGLVLIGAALLGFRAERRAARHALTELHAEVDRARRQTWDYQLRIAEQTEPAELRRAIERAGLELEPLPAAPARPGPPPGDRMAEATNVRQ